ncbi:MAG: HAMP domain-containing histidine kinase [Bdellovibrio sp.]|nr:HAMP domain-containing histidine kinase [Bdellovibrio sp.]
MKRRGMKLLIKIFLTFFCTALVIIGGVAWLSHSLQPEKQLSRILEKNSVLYVEALHAKLGANPDAARMTELYNDLNVSVRMQGHEEWANKRDLPTFQEVDEHTEHKSDKLVVGKYRSYFYAGLKNSSPRAVWFISAQDFPRGLLFPFVAIAAFVLLILALSFLTIRWMMSPLKVLLQGVHKISSGDLKYRVRTRHTREFQMIGEAFNKMADNLEKMITAKERLLRDVSHELRSPLTRVGVAVDLLPDEKLKVSIQEDLKKMEILVSEILESYRMREGAVALKKSPVNLVELVKHVVADYEESAPAIKVQLPEVAEANVDPMQIERVLRNLIENAVKYSHADSQPIQVSLKKGFCDWQMKVTDDGVGIEQKDMAQIFEPFYRTDSARTPGKAGFGLGLAIAKNIVLAHGGQLSVSRHGRGCEFLCVLPF